MKKIFALCMAGVMLMSTPVFAGVDIFVNVEKAEYTDCQPIIINDRLYVPFVRDETVEYGDDGSAVYTPVETHDVLGKLDFDTDRMWDVDEEFRKKEIYSIYKTRWFDISDMYHYRYVQITIDTKNNIVHCFNDSLDDKFKTFKLSNPIKIVDSQIMLPLREIYENLNCEVTWDDKARNVTVTDKNSYEELDKKADYLMGEKEEYDFDTIKEEGSFTDEEIVCIENMRELYDGVAQALEKTNPENINSFEEARMAYEKMNSAYMELCEYKPSESFKEIYDDFKKNYEANVEYYRDMIESISEFSDDEDVFFSVYWDDWYSFFTDCSITIRKFEDNLIRFAVERNISPDALLLALAGEEEYISIKQGMETESGREIYYAAQSYIDNVIEETGSVPENITVDILVEQGNLAYKPDMEYIIYVDKGNKKVEKVTWKSDVFSDGEGVFQGVNASELFEY